MVNFTDILNTPMREYKQAKPLPPGPYLGLIDGQPEITKRGKKETDCVVFPIKLVQAIDQTPKFQEELIEALEGRHLSDVKLSNTVWVTEGSSWRLRQFLVDHLGIELTPTLTGSEAIAAAQGRQLIVTLGHYVTNRDGETPRIGMEIKSTARA